MEISTGSKVSVIVPTKNSERKLRDCLNSIVGQSYEKIEIIVVDGHSTDDTLKILSDFPVKVIYEDKGTRAAACNAGISFSTGDIVAFTDSDCVVPKDWIERMVEHFRDPEVCAVGGSEITPTDSGVWEKVFGAIWKDIVQELIQFKEEEIHGCNSAYRKDAVTRVGAFNEGLSTTEETELHHRLRKNGCKLVSDDNIPVFHYRRSNLIQFCRQHFRYGMGKGRVLRLHPSFLKITDVIALSSIFIPILLFPILYFHFNEGRMLLTILLSLFLGTTFILSTCAAIKKKDILLIPLIFLVLIIYLYLQGLGHLYGLLKRK